MTTKDELIQEIEQSPEPLLKQVPEFIRSRKISQVDPIEAYLDQLRVNGDYADDITPEEGRDPGITAEELKAELFRTPNGIMCGHEA